MNCSSHLVVSVVFRWIAFAGLFAGVVEICVDCRAQTAGEIGMASDAMLAKMDSLRFKVEYGRDPPGSARNREVLYSRAGESVRLTAKYDLAELRMLEDFLFLDGQRYSVNSSNRDLIGVWSKKSLSANQMVVAPAGNWKVQEAMIPLLGIRFGSAGDGFYSLGELVQKCPDCKVEIDSELEGYKGHLVRFELADLFPTLAAQQFDVEVLVSPKHGMLPVVSRAIWAGANNKRSVTTTVAREIFDAGNELYFPVVVTARTEIANENRKHVMTERVSDLEINQQLHVEDFEFKFPPNSVVTYMDRPLVQEGEQNLVKAELLDASGDVAEIFTPGSGDNDGERLFELIKARLDSTPSLEHPVGANPAKSDSSLLGTIAPPVREQDTNPWSRSWILAGWTILPTGIVAFFLFRLIRKHRHS